MSTTNIDKLLDNIRRINLWQRLFGWARIKDQLIAATADLELLKATAGSIQEKASALSHNIDLLTQRNEHLNSEINRLNEANAHYRSQDDKRRLEHTEQMATLKQFQDRIYTEREKEKADRHQAELARIEQLKLTWYHHQEHVKQTLKALCNKHTIQYVDTVPFRGEPDNTVMICDEFIVFDAKSPGG
ncbi:MAG TPA: hypothetical protein VG605_21625 [Puia sp.]|nr:hypothetical protein [Puia sp.]